MTKKVLILLPDGISLRNFALTSFYQIGINEGFEIVYWNNTVFDLNKLGFKESRIQNSKLHPFTDILKSAKIHIVLNQFIKRTNDKIYDTYRFPFSNKNLKSKLKTTLIKLLINQFDSDKGLKVINNLIKKLERSTTYYKQCIEALKKEQPSIVFCTNQRPVTAIAPILAAQELGIPTSTFIFSWDNLPKASMVVETDYYFVWSNLMKKELMFYYPYIKEEQIFISGTPQFEAHFDINKLLSQKAFFEQYGLDNKKKYICYSGDDITTCPDDPKYLEDLALAVQKLIEKGYFLGIVFRRCPVDFSSRFDEVLSKYKHIITPLVPKWERQGNLWNTILPTQEDITLQMNTIAHSEMVVNLGSSMVFDYVAFEKPCAYINYDVVNKVLASWTVKKIYKFVHFRSMPNNKAVIWLNNKEEIAEKIENALNNSQITIEHAKNWFKIINQHSPQQASQRIWNNIKAIVK